MIFTIHSSVTAMCHNLRSNILRHFRFICCFFPLHPFGLPSVVTTMQYRGKSSVHLWDRTLSHGGGKQCQPAARSSDDPQEPKTRLMSRHTARTQPATKHGDIPSDSHHGRFCLFIVSVWQCPVVFHTNTERPEHNWSHLTTCIGGCCLCAKDTRAKREVSNGRPARSSVPTQKEGGGGGR